MLSVASISKSDLLLSRSSISEDLPSPCIKQLLILSMRYHYLVLLTLVLFASCSAKKVAVPDQDIDAVHVVEVGLIDFDLVDDESGEGIKELAKFTKGRGLKNGNYQSIKKLD